MKAIAFDAFGTLVKVTNGGSARTILNNITAGSGSVDETVFMAEWKAYYKDHTKHDCPFMKERDIFISRIQMFYDRYGVRRDAAEDADALLSGAFERESYPEAKTVLDKLRMKYPVFIASNTDNNVLDSVMRKNKITADKIYTSEDLKCYKPDRRFFDAVLADNDLTPQELLFVGDSVSDDILGPKALGIRTAWIDRNGIGGHHGQDYRISSLEELFPICGL